MKIMKITINKRLKTLTGLVLVCVLFLLPIAYTSYQPAASTNIINNEYTIDKSSFIELLYKDKIEKIDSFFEVHHNRYNFQGNILVAHKGNIIYSGSAGFADPNKETELNKDAVF